MKTSQPGINLIKKYEGCKLTAYKCPAGIWTIGYGHTAGVKLGMTITEQQAEDLLKSDLEKYEQKVAKYTQYNWKQHEFDALVSFAYNLGSIDQLTANGSRSRYVIADKIPLYNKAAGIELTGLTKRRREEQEMFLQKTGTSSAGRPTLRKGSTGSAVGELQKLLSDAGYPLVTDGIFGSKTNAAVRAYQKAQNLKVDGIAGPVTWSTLTK